MERVKKIFDSVVNSTISNSPLNLILFLVASYTISNSAVIIFALPRIYNTNIWSVKISDLVNPKLFFFALSINIFGLLVLILAAKIRKIKIRLFNRDTLLLSAGIIFVHFVSLLAIPGNRLSIMLFISSFSALLILQAITLLQNIFPPGLLEKFKDLDYRDPNISKIGILIPIFIIGTLFLLYSVLQHFTFKTAAWDLGIYDQATWLFSQFKNSTNTVIGLTAFGDHLELPLLYLSPIYWLFNSAYTLLIAQVLFILISAIPIYALAKEKLNSTIAGTFIASSYLLFFGIQSALDFDFHPLVMSLPFISFSLFFIEKKKTGLLLVSLFLMLITKENMAIHVAAIGLYLIIIQKRLKIGSFVVLFSLLYFLIVTQYLLPYLSGTDYRHFIYQDFGDNYISAAISMFSNPLFTIYSLFSPSIKAEVIAMTFGSFFFLPFLKRDYLILFIPHLVERFLSIKSETWLPVFHYSSVLTPYLAIATIHSIATISSRLNYNKYLFKTFISGAVLVNVILFGLRANILALPGPTSSLIKGELIPQKSEFSLANSTYKAISLIPIDASVITHDALVPHLTHRNQIYMFGGFNDQVDYALFNTSYSHWPLSNDQFNYIVKEYEESSNHETIFNSNQVLLFRKKS